MSTLKTVTDILTQVRIHINDQQATRWDDPTIKATIREAMQEAWPHFYVPLLDQTTYVSYANRIQSGTLDVAVPSTFLATDTADELRESTITGLEFRVATTQTPNPNRWFFMNQGIRIDRLSISGPRIYFSYDDGYDYEMKIHGAQPLTIPSGDAVKIPGTDIPGTYYYLIWRTEALLRAQKQKSGSFDRQAQGQRRLLAETQADKIATKYRMRNPYTTLFNQYD